jgi:DNA-binding response OmpR family regulator
MKTAAAALEWPPPVEAPGRPRLRVVGPGDRRILVVDDDQPILDLMTQVLGLNAYEVETARTVEEALPLALSGRHHGILLDLILPDANGLLLYRKINREDPALGSRVIFVTGMLDRGEVQRFRRLVGNRLLLKPFDLNDLLEAVRRVASPRD